MNQRYITVILPNGEHHTWILPHAPVSQENGSGMVFAWERSDGLFQHIAINLEAVVVLELGMKEEDMEPGALDLINQAKQREKGGVIEPNS